MTVAPAATRAMAPTMRIACSGSPTSPGPCPELRGSPAPPPVGAGVAAKVMTGSARARNVAMATDARPRKARRSDQRIDDAPGDAEQERTRASREQRGRQPRLAA